MYRIKPLNEELLLKVIRQSKRIVTLEENLLSGGIAGAIAEILANNGKALPLKRIAIPDQSCFKSGSRECLHSFLGLDVDSLTKTILHWLR